MCKLKVWSLTVKIKPFIATHELLSSNNVQWRRSCAGKMYCVLSKILPYCQNDDGINLSGYFKTDKSVSHINAHYASCVKVIPFEEKILSCRKSDGSTPVYLIS